MQVGHFHCAIALDISHISSTEPCKMVALYGARPATNRVRGIFGPRWHTKIDLESLNCSMLIQGSRRELNDSLRVIELFLL